MGEIRNEIRFGVTLQSQTSKVGWKPLGRKCVTPEYQGGRKNNYLRYPLPSRQRSGLVPKAKMPLEVKEPGLTYAAPVLMRKKSQWDPQRNASGKINSLSHTETVRKQRQSLRRNLKRKRKRRGRENIPSKANCHPENDLGPQFRNSERLSRELAHSTLWKFKQ